MLVAFGALAQAEEKDGMALLQEAQALMKDLAENRLPVGDCGKGVQEDQKKIINDFDALIKMILDKNADQNSGQQSTSNSPPKPTSGNTKPQNPPNSGPNNGKINKPGQPAPANKAGGNAIGSKPKEEPGSGFEPADLPIPPKYFDPTDMPKGTVKVPGYDDLLDRFRRAIAREGLRLP
jgi:hypothetical protein